MMVTRRSSTTYLPNVASSGFFTSRALCVSKSGRKKLHQHMVVPCASAASQCRVRAETELFCSRGCFTRAWACFCVRAAKLASAHLIVPLLPCGGIFPEVTVAGLKVYCPDLPGMEEIKVIVQSDMLECSLLVRSQPDQPLSLDK
eukprot:TRINITY_DN1581_c1_g1_i3.p1 TRINITY_DN1581_c1_g1~~TRINITY_DN1581_c1_g1_i3.p1  ORF type:complete len:145 (+),score=7.38 TRINITY_DN1581_c1_g1_i3:504-938(+)